MCTRPLWLYCTCRTNELLYPANVMLCTSGDFLLWPWLYFIHILTVSSGLSSHVHSCSRSPAWTLAFKQGTLVVFVCMRLCACVSVGKRKVSCHLCNKLICTSKRRTLVKSVVYKPQLCSLSLVKDCSIQLLCRNAI